MSAELLVGLLLGTAWALIDVWLLRRAIKKAYAVPKQAQRIIAATLAARYLLTFAVLVAALLLPGVDSIDYTKDCRRGYGAAAQIRS